MEKPLAPYISSYERLRPSHRLFIDKYLGEGFFNAKRSAELAGFKHPTTVGSKLKLRYSQIIEDRALALREAASMSAREVVEGLSDIARDKQHKDRKGALDTLAKIHGLLTDRIDLKVDRKLVAQEVESALLKLTAIPITASPLLPTVSPELPE